jgi:hypothetical protein
MFVATFAHSRRYDAACCTSVSSPHERRTLTVLYGHSRAEWPVAPHVLDARYGHEPLCWRCPDCAHIVRVFVFWRAESARSVRFGSALSANHRWCGLVMIRLRVRSVSSRSGLARTSALLRCLKVSGASVLTRRSGRCKSTARRSRRYPPQPAHQGWYPWPSCTPPPWPPAQGPGVAGAVCAAQRCIGMHGAASRRGHGRRYGTVCDVPQACRARRGMLQPPSTIHCPACSPRPPKRWMDARRQEGESTDVFAGERSSRCR